MGCVTDRNPVTFFIPFHFGHRARSFVRASDRWARTKPHSHNPTLPITQSSVASLSQADDGLDETGSKQTESWKSHFPCTIKVCNMRAYFYYESDDIQRRLMSTELA